MCVLFIIVYQKAHNASLSHCYGKFEDWIKMVFSSSLYYRDNFLIVINKQLVPSYYENILLSWPPTTLRLMVLASVHYSCLNQ